MHRPRQPVGTDGWLIAFDLDPANLEPARAQLSQIGENFDLHHGNFAGTDSFVYRVTDGAATSDATVTVTVLPVGGIPMNSA